MAAKPIRVFYSDMSNRFYATAAYRQLKSGLVMVTGNKFDVTDDIANLIAEHGIVFKEKGRADSGAAKEAWVDALESVSAQLMWIADERRLGREVPSEAWHQLWRNLEKVEHTRALLSKIDGGK